LSTTDCLEELKEGCLNVGLPFTPKFVCLDFEKGAIDDFEYCFPGILIIGCWFHYAQCLFKKIVAIGLKVQYGEDEELRVVVQNCISLALCYHIDEEHSEVIDIFCNHICNDKLLPLYHKYPRLKEFIKYMLLTWLEGDVENDIPPLFKISLWNHWFHMETRTNNTSEAYNFRIVIKLGNSAHPNIWIWIEFVQVEDLQMSVKFESISKEKFRARSRKTEIEKDLTISNAKLTFVQSDRGYEAIETLLAVFRGLCPKASF
jgi:hypothetical protein